jgi:hypothetical protein
MPKVFLSYRHESDANHPDHQQRVKGLGEKLKNAKLEVILDQFFIESNPGGPDEGWPKWCESRVDKSDKVLIVASDGYFQCYEGHQPPGTGLGAACETNTIRNALLYKNAYITSRLRIVYFENRHIAKIPNALYQIVHFDLNDPIAFSNLVSWLGGMQVSHDPVESSPELQIVWPAVQPVYEPDLANRNDEFSFFRSFVAGATSERAVFFEAPSNNGKTILVSECINYAKRALKNNSTFIIDFKCNPSYEAVLDTLKLELSELLPTFSKNGSQVRDLRFDLRVLPKPILLFFDTFEQASSDAREFVQNILLAELERTPALRIVIAGQNVPEYSKTLWAKSVRPFTLGPIREASHWTPFAQRKYPHIKNEQIKTLTEATGGNPGAIRMLIEGLGKNCGA